MTTIFPVPTTSRSAGELLRAVARSFTELQRQTADCCGMASLTRCQLLTTLGRRQPLTQAELGRALGLDKAWVSRTVEALEAEGLIRKAASKEDRRAVCLALTPEGQRQFTELERRLNAFAQELIGQVAPERQGAVLEALAVLAEALERQGDGPRDALLRTGARRLLPPAGRARRLAQH